MASEEKMRRAPGRKMSDARSDASTAASLDHGRGGPQYLYVVKYLEVLVQRRLQVHWLLDHLLMLTVLLQTMKMLMHLLP